MATRNAFVSYMSYDCALTMCFLHRYRLRSQPVFLSRLKAVRSLILFRTTNLTAHYVRVSFFTCGCTPTLCFVLILWLRSQRMFQSGNRTTHFIFVSITFFGYLSNKAFKGFPPFTSMSGGAM